MFDSLTLYNIPETHVLLINFSSQIAKFGKPKECA